MSSKSYDVSSVVIGGGGSKYGSVDANRSAENFKQESVSPIPDGPPKPAVRQRIQDKTSRNPPVQVSIDHIGQVVERTPEPLVLKEVPSSQDNTASQTRIEANNINSPEISNSSVALPEKPNANTKNSYLLPLPTNLKGNGNDDDDDNNNIIIKHSNSNIDDYDHEPTRPYPKKVLFIVGNEFCERFSYYGLRTILVLYFKSILGLSDSTSTVSFHLFATLCYLTPILGAILGDSIWGKFKTILYLSIVYFIGEVILVLSSIFWNEGALSTGATFLGLFFIGLGTGGIKPCVSALGGDQFYPNEERWRQNFFSLFYGAINLGSLISMFLTPMLRSNYNCVNRSDCYPYAFGLPCILMFLGIVVFLMAKNHYVITPLPQQNVIVAFCHCTYLALKRKILSQKPDTVGETTEKIHINSLSQSKGSSTSSLMDTTEDYTPVASIIQKPKRQAPNENAKLVSDGNLNDSLNISEKKLKSKDKHWLYLASDQYDKNSIEDFRSVLNILLIFLPTSVYWCLFDQQGSMWTLQATRMDGHIFNSDFILQPDQLSVANPLLLLASIPVYQMVIYPNLARFGILKKPIQKMTVGGLLAALTFIVSALIEVRIQDFAPAELPSPGKANLLLVNGLVDCSVTNPTISFTNPPAGIDGVPMIAVSNSSLDTGPTNATNSLSYRLNTLDPLASKTIDVQALRPLNLSSGVSNASLNYKLQFKLANSNEPNNNSINATTSLGYAQATGGCPLNPQLEHEVSLGLLPELSSRLVYITQGNGKLTHKSFANSLVMPESGKARVQLLYDSFGSVAQTNQRVFYLTRLFSSSGESQQNTTSVSSPFQFSAQSRDGQVIVSRYLDVPVPGKGDVFILRTSDNLIGPNSQQQHNILLKPGTRNLIVVHQKDATSVEIKQELLQDNDYMISMLYQLLPYLLISMSEVMFSITGLEFSYASAPDNMKSVILGAWSLMVALGNLLTVLIESVHPFNNIAHDFLFYAAIMTADMVLFAYIGYRYKPYKRQLD